MAGALIVAACLMYMTAALYAARWLYGHWRARSIDKLDCYPPTTEKAIENWNDIDRGPIMGAAVLCGLFWPLTAIIGPLGILVYRFLNSTPVLSQSELRDRLAERDKRIAQLEREAGITT
jgi:hypothetical protein